MHIYIYIVFKNQNQNSAKSEYRLLIPKISTRLKIKIRLHKVTYIVITDKKIWIDITTANVNKHQMYLISRILSRTLFTDTKKNRWN